MTSSFPAERTYRGPISRCAHQLRQVLHRHRSQVQHGLVIAGQVEPIAHLRLDALAQPAHRRAADEIRRKLAGRLLGTDDLQAGLAFRLVGLDRPAATGPLRRSSRRSASCDRGCCWSRPEAGTSTASAAGPGRRRHSPGRASSARSRPPSLRCKRPSPSTRRISDGLRLAYSNCT